MCPANLAVFLGSLTLLWLILKHSVARAGEKNGGGGSLMLIGRLPLVTEEKECYVTEQFSPCNTVGKLSTTYTCNDIRDLLYEC